MIIHNQFTLPELEFVGGATQELMFHCYHGTRDKPSNLSSCIADFSIISYVNKYGMPCVSKPMKILIGVGKDEGVYNILSVELEPDETVDLRGKYIYQITLRDVSGVSEIPGQGLLHINNNINKDFVK